jgi:hypothetical protein
MRNDLAIQHSPARTVPHPQPHASCGQAPHYARFHRQRREHGPQALKWLVDGEFKAKLSVTEGIDNGIDGFLGMLKGENFGKAVLQLADLTKE